MKFTETAIAGAWLIEPEPIADERGFFARTFCQDEFTRHRLNPRLVQCNISFNQRRGTLRGMHFQRPPLAEAKLVRCTQGAIYDVIVDLRTASPTRGYWFATELSAANRALLYIPEGLAHGFQTLCDGAEVFYQMSEFYSPEHAAGVRWDDPALQIRWPITPPIISARDRSYEDLRWPAAS